MKKKPWSDYDRNNQLAMWLLEDNAADATMKELLRDRYGGDCEIGALLRVFPYNLQYEAMLSLADYVAHYSSRYSHAKRSDLA